MTTNSEMQPLFGRYLLLNRIATGGMAEIFRALACGSEGFRKLVAIKRMLPELSEDSDFVDMFVNEAKLVANLHHANIVQLYDFGRIDDVLFYSMEYVHGRNVAEIIHEMANTDSSLPIEVACHIMIQTLEGLDHAHRQCDRFGNHLNIIHRDMSPHNIIVSYDGLVKIADFGIAKASRGVHQTAAGVIKGKFRYMSPEQSLARKVDQRTDIFTLGISFYEMLTLSDMFSDINEYRLLKQVRKVAFDRPRVRNPAIPEDLEGVLLKALEKNPGDRYVDAIEFRDALHTFLSDNNLRPQGSSSLVEFMQETFGEAILQEREQIAREAELAEEPAQQIGDLAEFPDLGVPAAEDAEEDLEEEVEDKRRLDETWDFRQQKPSKEPEPEKPDRQALRESRPTLQLMPDGPDEPEEEEEVTDPEAQAPDSFDREPLEKRRTLPVLPAFADKYETIEQASPRPRRKGLLEELLDDETKQYPALTKKKTEPKPSDEE